MALDIGVYRVEISKELCRVITSEKFSELSKSLIMLLNASWIITTWSLLLTRMDFNQSRQTEE